MFQQPGVSSFGFGSTTTAAAGQAAPAFSFGAAPAQQQQPAQTSLFGASVQQQPAGAPAAGGLFGSTAAQQQQRPAFGFGSALPTSTAAPAASAAPGASLFGQSAAGSSLFGAKPTVTAAPAGFGALGSNTAQGGLFGQTNPAPATGGLFGSAAQPQSNLGQLSQFGPQAQLQQQQIQAQNQQQQQLQSVQNDLQRMAACWNPQNPHCNFKMYFYNTVHPDDIALYQQPLQDGGLYQQAQLNNPDPKCMVPVLATGFEDLEKRLKVQEQHQEMQKQTLESISQRVDALVANQHKDIVTKIENYKRKHRQIVHKVFTLIKDVMLYRNRGYSIRADEEMLRARLEAMQRDLQRPSIFRGRLNEIWVQLNQLKEARRIQDDSAFYVADEASLAPVAEALEGLHNGLAHLTGVVREDQQMVEKMTQDYCELPFSR